MALNGIDLTVYKGEALGIIGSNGAGKSTLLKLLSRVTAPTEGEIDLYGRVSSMLEVGTGFNGEMTGRENVYLNGAILGMSASEIHRKMEQIIDFSEVRDFIDTPVKRYSSGMYVKLAFSVAAHLDSEILIMDEVLAVGDIAFQKKCLQKMREISSQENRTILYVSHNMNTIRELCDRCIVLDQGRIRYNGDVEKAIEIYTGTCGDDSLNTRYQLGELKRRGQCGMRMRFMELSFLNKESAVYNNTETAEILLRFRSDTDADDLFIAAVIKNRDNSSICVSGLSQKFSCSKGDNKIAVKIPLDLLEEDYYQLHIELITFDRNGNSLTYDNPFISFPFRILKTTDRLVWPVRYYGNVRQWGITAQVIR